MERKDKDIAKENRNINSVLDERTKEEH